MRVGPLKLIEAFVGSDLGLVALSVADNGAQLKVLLCLATLGAHFSSQLSSGVLIVEVSESLHQSHEDGQSGEA